MSEPVQHHYVPKAYLSSFENSQKPGSVYFCQRGKEVHLVNIEKVAKERHLYSFTDREGRLNTHVEKGLSQLEGEVKPVLSRLNETRKDLFLSIEETSLLLTFISVQAARTPAFKNIIKLLSADLAKLQLQQTASNIDWLRKILVKIKKTDVNAEQLQQFILDDSKYTIETGGDYYLMEQLRLQDEIHTAISQKPIALLISSAEHFITSDNPVMLVKDPSAPRHYGAGFLNSTVLLPVGKATCLMLTDKTEPDEGGATFVKLRKLPPAKVRQINRYTILNAEKYLFSSEYNKKIQRIFDGTKVPQRVQFSKIESGVAR